MDARDGVPNHSRRFATPGAVTSKTVNVECVSLADLLEREGLDFVDYLKVDIEGAEYELFEQTPPAVLARFRMIGLEYHGNQPMSVMTDRLRDAGFRQIRHVRHAPGKGTSEWTR
jgi:hypothetical protein